MAGPSATGNFAQAGLSAQRDNQALLKATLENSPDYSKIVQEVAVRKGKEEIASARAEQKVRKAKLEQYTATKNKKVVQDAEYDYKKSKAKAGKLAAAGGAIGGGLAMLAPSGRKKREVGAEDSFFQSRIDSNKAKAEEFRTQAAAIGTSGKMPGITPIGGESSGTNTGSSATSTTSGAGDNQSNSGDFSMQYMKKLTGAGMSDEQAAATVGHLRVETGGFKHMEELAPNVHGTKGYGHLQWTDPTPGSGRRTDFMNWSKSKNLDPQSFDANSGFLVHEITSNYNGSWTGGGSFGGLQQTGSLEEASGYLQNNFIRPGVPHTERRLAEGNNVLQQWRNYNSGN